MDRNKIPLPTTGNHARKKKDQTGTALKYPQGYFKEKACKYCTKLFQPNSPSEHYCTDGCSSNALAEARLQRIYNISIEDYKDIYIEQKGKCAICGGVGYDNLKRSVKMKLVVDHDHTTGAVRGLLCHPCNTALGQFQDDKNTILKAVDYLNKPVRIFSNTESFKHTLKRKSRRYSVTDEVLLQIIKDQHDKGFKRKDIMDKYHLTEAVTKAIMQKIPYAVKRVYQKYINLESATTIPEGSTLQADGSGSGLHPTR